MLAPPENYDAYTIASAPALMYDTATNVSTSAANIVSCLSNIINAVTSLRLSWTGTSASSASLAQDFNNRWAAITTALYGTQGDPSSGAINQLMEGLALAAQNYLNNEDQVAGMFSAYSNAGSGGPSGQSVVDQVTNGYYHTTSVNETF